MRTLLATAALCLAAAPSFAQGAESRFSVSVNAGYQAATNDFSDRVTFEVYKEQGTTEAQYPVRGDVLFDAGGSVRIWKRLGAGVTVSRYTRNAAVHTVSRVPHPLYLEQPREMIGDPGGITRAETSAHVQILYLLPTPGRLRITAAAGPSYINVEQDLIAMVRYQDTYPFDVATFTGADTRRARRGAAGFNVGADATWMFNRTFGAGGVVRFTRATVTLNAPENRTLSVDAGGTQAGVGIRIRF